MKQVYLILTKDCNLSCNFCIRRYSDNNNVILKYFEYVLNEIKSLYPDVNIILSGGEPTLIKDFYKYLKLALDNFEKVTINSNGTTDFFKSELFLQIVKSKKIDIQFSIDGYKDLHDKIRGKGNYEKTIDNIKYCSEIKNIKMIVSTTVTSKKFLNKFKKLYDEMVLIKNIKWNIKRVTYSGNANFKSFYYMDNNEWNEIVEFIKENDYKNIVNIYKTFDFELLDSIDDEILKSYENKIMKNCGSGKEKIYIYPNMDVLACSCYEKLPLGNLLDNSLKDIINSTQHKKIVNYTIDHPVCNKCRYKILCNGGCLGSGFSTFGKLGIPDIRCPKIYEYYKGDFNVLGG